MDSGLDILDPGVPGNSPPGGVSTTTGARPPRQARYQRRYRRREGAAFWKNVRRSFEGTISRWLAVFAIIALGGGVFAGLQSVSPDMYRSADALYDGTNFMHLRVTSTMGLTDEDAQALRQVPGVRAAQPQIITEGSILDNGTAHASAILSLDLNQTESSNRATSTAARSTAPPWSRAGSRRRPTNCCSRAARRRATTPPGWATS